MDIKLTLIGALICFLLVSLAQGSEDEKRLIKDLMSNYTPEVVPVRNASETLTVTVGLTIMNLLEVDEKTHILETLTWIQEEWNDYTLSWDPNEYGNITNIKLPPNRVWKPDTTFYNHGAGKDPFQDTLAYIKNDGNVSLIRPGNVEIACKFDLTYFPLDKHDCHFKLGSWVHDGLKMDLKLSSDEGADLGSFVKNTRWNVENKGATRNAIYYACCPEPYVDLTFRLKISRRGEDSEQTASHINHLIMGILIIAVLLDISVGLRNQLGLVGIIISFTTAVLMCPESANNFIQAPLIVKHFISMGFVGLYVILWTIFMQFISSLNCAMPQWLKRLTIDGIIMQKAKFCVPLMSSNASDTRQSRIDSGMDVSPFTSNRQSNTRNSLSQPLTDEVCKDSGNRDWAILAIFTDRILKVVWICVILVTSLLCYPTFPSE